LDFEVSGVSLDLVTEGIVTKREAGINHLLDKSDDLLTVLVQRDHVVSADCGLLVGWEVGIIELWDLVKAGNLTESSKEVISSDCSLTVEEGEPEDLSVLGLKAGHDLISQVVVHDVFEINFVEVISPWVENAEAFMLDALGSILDDILFDEFEGGLIGGNWVVQVILVELLLWVTDERSDSTNAS